MSRRLRYLRIDSEYAYGVNLQSDRMLEGTGAEGGLPRVEAAGQRWLSGAAPEIDPRSNEWEVAVRELRELPGFPRAYGTSRFDVVDHPIASHVLASVGSVLRRHFSFLRPGDIQSSLRIGPLVFSKLKTPHPPRSVYGEGDVIFVDTRTADRMMAAGIVVGHGPVRLKSEEIEDLRELWPWRPVGATLPTGSVIFRDERTGFLGFTDRAEESLDPVTQSLLRPVDFLPRQRSAVLVDQTPPFPGSPPVPPPVVYRPLVEEFGEG